MKIYISGVREEEERYKHAEEQLKKEGHEVVNFLNIISQIDNMDKDKQEQMECLLVKSCDAIFVLNGYKNSDDAVREIFTAVSNEVNVFFEQK